MSSPIRLATRQSPLALWQANWVSAQLQTAGHDVEMVLISTRGDVDQRPINASSSVGMFTKGIQQAVLKGEADVAIHSLKDLPTAPVEGLSLVATPKRAPVRDCLVTVDNIGLDELPQGAVVGTGSRRREAQLRFHRRDLDVRSIRGNVETRLAKLDEGEYKAIVLAEAGLQRLELQERTTQPLDPHTMLPAPGQGALGIEIRTEDQECRAALATLNDPDTMASVTAERRVLSLLQGGCLAPIGTYGRCVDDQLHLDAVVVSIDGSMRLHSQGTRSVGSLDDLAEEIAQDLIEQGASKLIHDLRD